MAKKKKRRARKKYEVDGITFDSKTEKVHYEILSEHPLVEVLDVHKTFLLMDKFKYTRLPTFSNGTHRKMIYTPDFIIKVKGIDKPIAMETKGHPRKDYMIRKKLFTYFYGNEYYFYECKDKSSGEQLRKDLEVMTSERSKKNTKDS